MTTNKSSYTPRWGIIDTHDTHYVYIPGYIMRQLASFGNWHPGPKTSRHEFGISPGEFMFIATSMMFKFDVKDSESRPSLATIAKLMGISEDMVRRHKQSLVRKGALHEINRGAEGQTSIFDYFPLAKVSFTNDLAQRDPAAFERLQYADQQGATWWEREDWMNYILFGPK